MELKDYLELAAVAAGYIVAFATMRANLANHIKNTERAIKEMDDKFEKLEAALEKTREKNDRFYAECRAVTLGIQRGISRLEGKLGVHSRED